ncbi:hypothetical protein A3Q56_04775, partial [Intoshia linei]
ENKSNGPEENDTTKELESTIKSMTILNQDKDVNTESIKSKIIDIPSEKLETADIDIIKDETNKMLDVTDSTFDIKIEKEKIMKTCQTLQKSHNQHEFNESRHPMYLNFDGNAPVYSNQLANVYLARPTNPQVEINNNNGNAYTNLSRIINVHKAQPNQVYTKNSQCYYQDNYSTPQIHQNNQFNRYKNPENSKYVYSSQNISQKFNQNYITFPNDNESIPDFNSIFNPSKK